MFVRQHFYCGFCGCQQDKDSKVQTLFPCDTCEEIQYCDAECKAEHATKHQTMCAYTADLVASINDDMQNILENTDENGNLDFEVVVQLYDESMDKLVLRVVINAMETHDRFPMHQAKEWLLYLESLLNVVENCIATDENWDLWRILLEEYELMLLFFEIVSQNPIYSNWFDTRIAHNIANFFYHFLSIPDGPSNPSNFLASFDVFQDLALASPPESCLKRIYYNRPVMDLIEDHILLQKEKEMQFLVWQSKNKLMESSIAQYKHWIKELFYHVLSQFPDKAFILDEVQNDLFGEEFVKNLVQNQNE